jgi:hypothetical protein
MKNYFSNELIYVLIALVIWMLTPIGLELYHRYHYANDLNPIIVLAEENNHIETEVKRPDKKQFHTNVAQSKHLPKINLNTCDTNTLKKVNGIGTVLANRIIKYRNYLNGFVNIDQLKEVYGLKPEVFQQIKGNFMVASNHRKVLSKDTLLKNPFHYHHPYLKKELKYYLQSKRKEKTFTIDSLDVLLSNHSYIALKAYCY